MRRVTIAQLQRRVARNTRRLRLDRALTQMGAAALVGMHWRHWQKIEAAKVNLTLETLCKLARALDVDPADLLRAPAP